MRTIKDLRKYQFLKDPDGWEWVPFVELKEVETLHKEQIDGEIKICLNIIENKGMDKCKWGYCGHCGVPYLLWKMKTGEVIDDDKIELPEMIVKLKESLEEDKS